MKTVLADPSHQVRKALDESAVKQMMTTLRSGGVLPPIQIVRVKGLPYLADGWHRYEAHSRLGGKTIKAHVTDGTVSDLRRVALQANLTHGVRLKSTEKRGVFQKFIRARLHREGGKLMSYRDLERALCGIASHVTLRTWMERDFPNIFRQMAGLELEQTEPTSDPKINAGKQYARAAVNALEAARNHLPKVERADRESLQTLWALAVSLAADVEAWHGKPLGDEFDRPQDEGEQVKNGTPDDAAF